jgi:hypothetical protein
MSAVPNVRRTAQALYPLTRLREYSTDVCQFVNGTEQRFKTRAPLTRLKLTYSSLPADDTTGLKDFVDSAKGMFDTTNTITIGTEDLANLTLGQDTIQVTEQESLLYNTQLELRQTQNRGFTRPVVDPVWPTFANGCTAQRPYIQIRRFLTSLVDQASGLRYAWAWYGEGLTGFPDGALMAWELTLLLDNTDIVTLETFFQSMEGRLRTWSFTDPDDNSVHSHCRFDMDSLEIQAASFNLNRVTVKLREFNT